MHPLTIIQQTVNIDTSTSNRNVRKAYYMYGEENETKFEIIQNHNGE